MLGATHPDAAHFHADKLTTYAPFLQKFPPTNSDGVFAMNVYNGTLANNAAVWTADFVKVHDYANLEGGQPKMGAVAGNTAFTITEIPEPATVITFAVGGAFLGIAALRRWRRRTQLA